MRIVIQTLALTDSRSEWTPHTLEMLTDATKLAERLQGDSAAWVVGAGTEHGATLAKYGCRVVHRLCHERLSKWQSEAVASALADHTVADSRVIFLPAGAQGEEVAALLATRLDADWVPDVTSLAVTRTGTLEVSAVEPGGKLSRTWRNAVDRPVIITMRAGVAEARPIDAPGEIYTEDRDIDLSDVPELTQTERFLPADPATVDITHAERIVAGGRGMGRPEGMQLVTSLAESLGASPAASRVAVDLCWASPQRQVGQTGRTVRPDLYVACGISGASHHLAGMRDSRHIVAINNDPQAPIHEVAHLSLYGDVHQVLPAIREAVVRRLAAKQDMRNEKS